MTTIERNDQINQPVEEIKRPNIRVLERKGRKEVDKLISKLNKLTVEYVPIDSVYPNAYNPNRQSKHEFELLKMSIMEDGFTQPIVVHQSTRMIVDGEHRWRAMHQLGFKTIAAVMVDMTDQQMRISTLRHNRARGSEDVELSIQVLKDLRELGALDKAVKSLDIDDIELQALLNDLPIPEIMASEDFSKGWTPDKTMDAIDPERVLKDRRISTSTEAQKILTTIREKKNTEGNTLLQDQEINYESTFAVAQVSCTIELEDAKFVRQILGDRPAQRLIELCVLLITANPHEFTDEIYGLAIKARNIWEESARLRQEGTN